MAVLGVEKEATRDRVAEAAREVLDADRLDLAGRARQVDAGRERPGGARAIVEHAILATPGGRLAAPPR
jgi:hypothetical protein